MSYSSPSLGKPVVAFTSLVPTVNQNKREVILRLWSYALQRHVDLWVCAVCFFPETSERQLVLCTYKTTADIFPAVRTSSLT